MRPIDKGVCPQENGADKTVTTYGLWRKDLINRIGCYCVYCNMPLTTQLNVEHAVPKNPQPGAPAGSRLAWDNMLLACGPCNNAKSNDPSDPTLHYLPESHNGLLAFTTATASSHPNAVVMIPDSTPARTHPGILRDYDEAVIIIPRTGAQSTKAEETIRLFKLNQVDPRGDVVDLRWQKRFDAYIAVRSVVSQLQMVKDSPTYDATAFGKHIAIMAESRGFFSLWFEAFANEPEVLRALIDPTIIPGTAQSCFDRANGYRPIAGAGLTQPPPPNP